MDACGGDNTTGGSDDVSGRDSDRGLDSGLVTIGWTICHGLVFVFRFVVFSDGRSGGIC